jgi:NAD(P)-dependent dehydrogenase (short-subunit alcohol dehydrogenase family)
MSIGSVLRVAGKKALVTGGARGIGAACARMLARHGAQVALADIDGEGARSATEEINAECPDAAIAVDLDVTDPEQWSAALQSAHAHFGGLNVLVNNAGVCIPGSIEDLDIADWNRTIDIDLNSVFLGCRAALPLMRDHAPGSIVNISSISGLIAGHNLAAYNAAKAGVWLVTKSIALHAARKGYDIRANSVHPTFIDTGMVDEVVSISDPAEARAKLARQIPLGRIGTTDDVAYAVLYLASDESRFMTGSELKLDGGISAM